MRGEGKRAKQRLKSDLVRLHGSGVPFQATADGVSGTTITLKEEGDPFEQPAAKIKGLVVQPDDLVLVAPIGDGQEFVVIGAIDDGVVPASIELPGQIETVGTAPSLTILGAAGSTATGSIIGTDGAGLIQLTPGGTGIASGLIFTVTFSAPRVSANYFVGLTPNSSSARGVSNIGPSGRASIAFSITVGSALTSGNNYQWLYLVVGY